MTERDFDIWLHGFARETREAPPLAISRVFGIPVRAAEVLVATLPRVVKRDASADQAERLVHALEAIGGVAEAVPTRVVPAPVLVVGTQPVQPRPETLVRYAPRARAPREQAGLAETAGTGETLKLGTHELAAYFPAGAVVAPWMGVAVAPQSVASPDDTLVDPMPPCFGQAAPPPPWSDLDRTPPDAGEPVRTSSHPTAPEQPLPPRGRWDDIELAAPEALPPISLAPPSLQQADRLDGTASNIEITRDAHSWLEQVAQQPIPLAPLSSHPPPASDTSWITLTPHPIPQPGSGGPAQWRNPMALPPREPPSRSLGLRSPAERMRGARARPQAPTSLVPRSKVEDPNLIDALGLLGRGDLRGASRASPTLAFALILAGVTLAFAIAYAAW